MARITPHVFISAASDDLRSSRQVVKNALLTVGCYPIVQEHFEPDYRTVKEMIRERIEECHAVVHLVGKRYGGEPSPTSLPPGESRKSWTQMEFHLARALGKKLFLFVCDECYPFDVQELPEPEDEVELQEAHRQRILTGEQLYIIVSSKEELALRISEMQLEAAELREEVKRSRNQLSDALETMERSSARLASGQGRILAGLADLSVSFSELATLGGIIPNPGSPEQFYHNARLFEMKGDYGNARRSYLEYFKFDLDFLDPHLRFQDFLKVQEGREGARETYQVIARNSKGTLAQFAMSLLWDRSQRVVRGAEYLRAHPDFGPAHYLLSLDFAESRLGTQSLMDKRRERDLLESFRVLDGRGKVVRWILDKSEISEWRSDAESRLALLESSRFAMDNPVSVYWTNHNSGWTGTIQIAEMAREIFWQKPGSGEFVSTGFSSARCYSTGLPHPQPNIELPRKSPEAVFEVKYLNLNGEEMGPFPVRFDPFEESVIQTKQILGVTRTAWVSFREFDGKLLLYFSHLLCYRGGLKSIRFGLDQDTPNLEFPFSPATTPGTAEIGADDIIYLEVPTGTAYVTVKVIYRDGEESGVERFER